MDIEQLALDMEHHVLRPLAEGGSTKIGSDVAVAVGVAAAEEVVQAVVKIKVRLEEAFAGSPQAARLERFMSDPSKGISTVIRHKLRRDEALASQLDRDLYTPSSRTGLSVDEMLRKAETLRRPQVSETLHRPQVSPFDMPTMTDIAAKPAGIEGDRVERILRRGRNPDD